MLEQFIATIPICGLLVWILLNQLKRIDGHEVSIKSILEITIKSQNSIVSIIQHLQEHDSDISKILEQISDNQKSIATLLERTKKL